MPTVRSGTYQALERRGWIEPCDEIPCHRATPPPKGLDALVAAHEKAGNTERTAEMLTDIKYIGTPNDDRGYTAIICAAHNYRDMAAYVYQLEELECPRCYAEEQAECDEYAAWKERVIRSGHPSICLCPVCAPAEHQPEPTPILDLTLYSSDYCNHRDADRVGWGCLDSEHCKNERCKYERENPPF